jgi:prevent-host-death family protein
MGSKGPNVWTLQDAKNRFSEVVRNAIETGPQTVTRHGKAAVIVISAADYERENRPFLSAYDALRPPGFEGVDLDIERDRGEMRHVDFSEPD